MASNTWANPVTLHKVRVTNTTYKQRNFTLKTFFLENLDVKKYLQLCKWTHHIWIACLWTARYGKLFHIQIPFLQRTNLCFQIPFPVALWTYDARKGISCFVSNILKFIWRLFYNSSLVYFYSLWFLGKNALKDIWFKIDRFSLMTLQIEA